MPELPEVEVTRRGIEPELAGQRFLGATVRFPSLRLPIPPDLAQRLAGRRLERIVRRGKYLLFDCEAAGGGGWLLLHLGMSGSLRLVAAETPPEKHDHVDLRFAGRSLRFRDPRRFGVLLWLDGPEWAAHPLLVDLGIEPLTAEFDGAKLQALFARRQSPVKLVLMDAHVLVGVGNIYAAESLFRAGISPFRPAASLSRAECERLAVAVQDTLRAAIAAGGSSLRDFVHSDGSSGYFQIDCAVYGRAGQVCRRCSGQVGQVRQAGRATFYCQNCQI